MYPWLRVSTNTPHTHGRKLLRKFAILHRCGHNMSQMDWSKPAIAGYVSKWVKLAMRHLCLQIGIWWRKYGLDQRKQGQFGDMFNSHMYKYSPINISQIYIYIEVSVVRLYMILNQQSAWTRHLSKDGEMTTEKCNSLATRQISHNLSNGIGCRIWDIPQNGNINGKIRL